MGRILSNLRENVSTSISKNLGLKIMAVFFAVLLWWTVVNIDDPIQTKKYMVEVTVINPEVITNKGESFQVDESTKTVTVTVKARRKVIEKIKTNHLVATADMREKQGSSVPVRINITGFEGSYESATAYPQNIQVNVEATQKKTFPITAVAKGNVRDGCVLAGLSVSPQSVDVSGPTSIVSKISKVVAQVDVTGLAAGRDVNTNLIYYDAADNQISQMHLSSSYDSTGVDVHVSVWETKTVLIAFDTSKVKVGQGYLFNGIEFEPQTIEIAANREKLNSLETLDIPAEAISRVGIIENEVIVVDVSQYLPEGVILADADASSVVVELQVEKIGTKSFSIPVRSIRVDGMAEGMQLEYGPEQSVAIVFEGRDEMLEGLSLETFVASVDLSEFTDPGEYSVPVIISEQPEGCEYAGDATINIILSVKEDLTVDPNTGEDPEVSVEPEV